MLDNIPNRKEWKTYLHFHFHTFTEDLTMGTAVLSFLLSSSRPFHSETARQRSTTVLRQWQQEGLRQPTDRLVNLHLHINRAQLEWISFLNWPERRNPWQSHNCREGNQQLICINLPDRSVRRKHVTRLYQNAAKLRHLIGRLFYDRLRNKLLFLTLTCPPTRRPTAVLKQSLKYSRTLILHLKLF